MTVLFWDIDGTLLSTARAGIFAWEDAIADVLGKRVSLEDYQTAGRTDVEIARGLVGRVGADAAPDAYLHAGMPVADLLLCRYEELLPSRLHRRRGAALPGIIEILEQVRKQPDAISILLTGNTMLGACAKLTHYALAEYFVEVEEDAATSKHNGLSGDGSGQPPAVGWEFEPQSLIGSFADGANDRLTIARRALQLAKRQVGPVPPERAYVIGDTPHDISCGKAIGARTVAVATGSYSLDELTCHDPWWGVENLAGYGDVLEKIGLDPAPER